MKSVFSILKLPTIFFVLSRTKTLSETTKQYFLDKNNSSNCSTKKTIFFVNSVYRKVSLLTQIKISPDSATSVILVPECFKGGPSTVMILGKIKSSSDLKVI